MPQSPDKDTVLKAIREACKTLGHVPSRREFVAKSGITEYHVLTHFPSWREAVRAAGLQPDSSNQPLDPSVLLEDWVKWFGEITRFRPGINTEEKVDTALASLTGNLDHGPEYPFISRYLRHRTLNGQM